MNIEIGEKGEEITKEHSIIEEKAYRDTWGKGTESFLQMLYDRLILMKDLLSKRGAIYVHLDWRMASYIRIIMDEIFGSDNYIREIIWRMGWISGYKTMANNWIRNHDNILFYTKDPNHFTFNKKWIPYPPDYERWGGRPKGQGLAIEDVWGVFPGEGVNSLAVVSFAKENLAFPTQKAEGLLKRIVEVSSNEGDLVADFFCGSGTTLAVAEKLNRRWIGVDLGRFAIHTTRKRLLEIENSKDLLYEGKKYGKKARPFEILNLGKYERQFWQVSAFGRKDEKKALFEYLAFILKLYGAEPISGSTHIHGKKGNALVYIGAVDSPVTIQEVQDALNDTKTLGLKELHVLGWEWEMGLNDAIQEVAKQLGIRLKLRIIPMDVLDPQAVAKGDIRFFELAYFNADIETKGKTVKVKLDNFVIPHTDLIPPEVKDSIKKWQDWIDYWAVDFDFQNDTFNNGWTSYRTKANRKLKLAAEHTYEKSGTYKIFIKIIDIFGIDTSQIFEVKVK
jgi:DNA modification methylase